MAAGDGYFVLFCLFLVIGTCLAQKDELGVEESLSKQEELKFKDRGEQFDKDFAVLNQDNSKSVGAKYDYIFYFLIIVLQDLALFQWILSLWYFLRWWKRR